MNGFKFQFLLLQDLLGEYDHDFSGKLAYFEKAWNLQHPPIASQSKFTSFDEKELERCHQSLILISKDRAFQSINDKNSNRIKANSHSHEPSMLVRSVLKVQAQ